MRHELVQVARPRPQVVFKREGQVRKEKKSGAETLVAQLQRGLPYLVTGELRSPAALKHQGAVILDAEEHSLLQFALGRDLRRLFAREPVNVGGCDADDADTPNEQDHRRVFGLGPMRPRTFSISGGTLRILGSRPDNLQRVVVPEVNDVLKRG